MDNSSGRLCGARAIINGSTYLGDTIFGRKLTENEIRYIRKGRQLQTVLAEELCRRLGTYNESGFNFADLKNCEKLLDIQIKVVSAEHFNSVTYAGDQDIDLPMTST